MPAKTYRAAVIGSTGRGDYGHGIDVVWKDIARAKLVAVADDNPRGLEAAGKRLGLSGGELFGDYRKMLDAVTPDVVSICPRWIDRHHEFVMAAVERGIHIFMEKPFCRTLEEADAIVAACERTHVRVAIACQTRYSPKIDVVKKLIADGQLGTLLEFRARGKEDGRGGGEDLWVLGTHVLDLVRLFGGDPTWCMAEVLQGGRPITAADIKPGNEGLGPLAGDAVRAMYGMPGGATAYFASNRGAGGNPSRFGLQIFGTKGVLEILTGYLPSVKFSPDPAWCAGRSNAKWLNVSSAGVDRPEPIKDGGAHQGNVAAVNDLLDAVEQHRPTKCSEYDGRGFVELILAVFESHRVGGKVSLPLANRKHPLTMLGR